MLHWFEINSMAANPHKFQIMLLGIPDNSIINFSIENITIKASNRIKLLGIEIDHKLNFSNHKPTRK